MRRRLGLLLALLLVLITGCGGGSEVASGGDAATTALSYLPKDALVAVLVQTDPDAAQVKSALDLVRRFPGGDAVLGQLQSSVAAGDLDYDEDVKPMLGNPLAFSATGTAEDPLFAWQVKDTDALDRTLEKSGARESGEYEGATLYRRPGTSYATDDDLLLVANTEREVRAALDRHADDAGLSPDDFPEDLPEDTLVRATGSIAGVLANASTPGVRRVPWLAAVERFGFAVTADDDGAGFELRAETSRRDLDDAEVPVATGDATPEVVDTEQVALGLRDLDHAFDFAVAAARVINPEGTTEFEANLQSLKGFAGVDVRAELLDQLDSDATFVTNLGDGVALRATAKDPAVVTRALDRLERVVPSALTGVGIYGARVASAGPGLWTVSQSGTVIGGYGVVDDQLVAGSGSLAELQDLARRPTDSLPDAEGALALRMPGPVLARLISAQFDIPSGLGSFALGRLGDLTGSMSATPERLRGSFRLPVR